MSPHDLRDTLKQVPFQPFRIVLGDGTTCDIRHPDLVWVGLSSIMVGVNADPLSPFYDHSIKMSLRHINRLEPLPQTSSGGNGQQ